MESIKEAIEYFGSGKKLAESVGVTDEAVSRWLNGNAKPSYTNAKKIETVTNGKVSRHDLRPDIFGEDKAA